ATFLLWMLTELFENLPEVGDLDKPKMIFFFDEAHLLFDGAPRALVQKIVQVVKLIRSKGVGVYFVTQSPSDIPDEVLAQLSNRVQHGLRAYTPAEQKAVRAAARAFRTNPSFNTEEALMALGTGEALVSFLDEKGVPGIVECAKILPPQSLMGACDRSIVERTILADEFELKYRDSVDRESAYEIIMKANEELARQREAEQEELERQKEEEAAEKQRQKEEAAAEKQRQKDALAAERQKLKDEMAAEKQRQRDLLAAEKASAKTSGTASKYAQRAATSAASSVASSLTRNMVNSFTGGKTISSGTIAKRAATNALSSVARSGATSIVRGLFGNKR
ncbi:MAG: DUF853 family protein, partial [Clostridia bacterium]|nr:DUF853 family protein [Clostridia bacterium]